MIGEKITLCVRRARPIQNPRPQHVITDLYVDHHKFKGQNVTSQVPQLQRVLQDYSIDALLAFFAR